jgi:hypothetical protein
MTTKLLDQFSVRLLDMNGTFMFGADRFGLIHKQIVRHTQTTYCQACWQLKPRRQTSMLHHNDYTLTLETSKPNTTNESFTQFPHPLFRCPPSRTMTQ